jgi:hypothetical protein
MSVTLNRSGGLEPPETTALTTADATTVHTASAYFVRIIEAIVLANIDVANACEVTLRWVNATPTATIFWQGDIPAGTTVVIDTIPIMTDGKGTVRSITAEAENANDINVTVITSHHSKQAHTIS